MDYTKKGLKIAMLSISGAILLSMFLPMTKEVYEGEVDKTYFYQILSTGGMYFVLAALLAGTAILFSNFKNKDMMAVGFLLFACVYMMFYCCLCVRAVNKDKDLDGQIGMYFLLLLAFSQLCAAIVYAAVCVWDNYYYEQDYDGQE